MRGTMYLPTVCLYRVLPYNNEDGSKYIFTCTNKLCILRAIKNCTEVRFLRLYNVGGRKFLSPTRGAIEL